MKFEKTDSKELQKTIAILISAIIILIPITYTLFALDIIEIFNVSFSEIVVVFGGLIIGMFVVMYLSQKENRHLTWLDILLIANAISLILSTLFAKNPTLALTGNLYSNEGLIVYLIYLIILLGCSFIDNPKYRRIIYGAFIIYGAYEFFVAVMQSVFINETFLFGYTPDESTTYRAFGTIFNQDMFGSMMVVFTGLEIGLFYVAESKKMKFLHAIGVIAFALCIMLSGTRGAMVGILGSCFIFALYIIISKLVKKEKMGRELANIGIVIALLAVVVLVTSLSAGYVFDDVVNRTSNDATAATENVVKLGNGRMEIYKSAWNKYVVNYPVLGVGIANVFLAFFNGDKLGYTYDAHNEYLHILCTQGIVGLVAFLALQIYILVYAFKKLKKNGIKESKELFGLMIAYVGYIIAANFGLRIIYLTPYLFMLMGIIINRQELKAIKIKKH